MRKCKLCNGTGIVFMKSNAIDTGKETSIMGMSFPKYTSGKEKATCTKCFGKGVKQ